MNPQSHNRVAQCLLKLSSASGIGLLYSESRANRVFVYTITRWVIGFGGATLW